MLVLHCLMLTSMSYFIRSRFPFIIFEKKISIIVLRTFHPTFDMSFNDILFYEKKKSFGATITIVNFFNFNFGNIFLVQQL